MDSRGGHDEIPNSKAGCQAQEQRRRWRGCHDRRESSRRWPSGWFPWVEGYFPRPPGLPGSESGAGPNAAEANPAPTGQRPIRRQRRLTPENTLTIRLQSSQKQL